MTLRERVQAMAEEYQRDPRWLRSVDVGKLMEEWLSEPEIQPGPCMAAAPTLTAGPRSVSCTLLAGHAGGHTNGATSWTNTITPPDADVERTDFRPGNGPKRRTLHVNCPHDPDSDGGEAIMICDGDAWT